MTSQVPYTTTSHNIYITLLGTIKTNYKRHKIPKRVTEPKKPLYVTSDKSSMAISQSSVIADSQCLACSVKEHFNPVIFIRVIIDPCIQLDTNQARNPKLTIYNDAFLTL